MPFRAPLAIAAMAGTVWIAATMLRQDDRDRADIRSDHVTSTRVAERDRALHAPSTPVVRALPESPGLPAHGDATLGKLVVRVAEHSGQPVANVEVRIREVIPSARPTAIITVATDEDGRCEAHDLTPGRYRVEASARDRIAASSAVDLEEGAPPVTIDLVLRDGARFIGRAQLANGLPATDLELTFLPREGNTTGPPAAIAWPDERGDFASAPLEPGRWLLNLARLSDGQLLELRQLELGRTDQHIGLMIRASGSVRGLVTDSRGLPVAADVFLTPRDEDQRLGGVMTSSSTARYGAFEFGVVPVGEWHMTVEASGFARDQRVLQVAAGLPLEALVELAPGGSINGRILAAGVPVAGASFRLLRREPNELVPVAGSWTSGDDGSFALRHLPYGRYDLKVTSPDHAFAAVRGVEVQPDSTGCSLTIELGHGGTLAGVAQTRTGGPATGRMVLRVRHPEAGLRVFAVSLDENGRFEAPNLPAGTVDVEARWSSLRDSDPHLEIREGETTDWQVRF